LGKKFAWVICPCALKLNSTAAALHFSLKDMVVNLTDTFTVQFHQQNHSGLQASQIDCNAPIITEQHANSLLIS
jgi:hypothetical protein